MTTEVPTSARAKESPALFDESDDALRILDAVIQLPRQPLLESRVTTQAGIYLLFYDGPLAVYTRIADGSYPVYVGAAVNLAERLTRHRRNLRRVDNLDGGDHLHVLTMATESCAGALYAESLIGHLLAPVWNQPFLSGFGSRAQGANRTGQAPPPWDVLHPGRRVGRGPTTVTTALLERAARDHLARTVRPAWAKLVA